MIKLSVSQECRHSSIYTNLSFLLIVDICSVFQSICCTHGHLLEKCLIFVFCRFTSLEMPQSNLYHLKESSNLKP